MKIVFSDVIKPLIGQKINHAWKGYGSAIFLEIGDLVFPSESSSTKMPSGQWCISIEWDWRVEYQNRILFGSSHTGSSIADRLKGLEGTMIQDVELWGAVPEILVHLSDSSRLRSASMVNGQPEWSIRLGESDWISAVEGEIHSNYAGPGLSEEAKLAFRYANQTVERWGQIQEGSDQKCSNCRSYLRLNGEGAFHDFGVCSQNGSLKDGRVVHCNDCCSFFKTG